MSLNELKDISTSATDVPCFKAEPGLQKGRLMTYLEINDPIAVLDMLELAELVRAEESEEDAD